MLSPYYLKCSLHIICLIKLFINILLLIERPLAHVLMSTGSHGLSLNQEVLKSTSNVPETPNSLLSTDPDSGCGSSVSTLEPPLEQCKV